ncbi:uncharacterized protein LOC135489881 [Lineus longissimus]|uniref:uncharacterized protein LOC135489881 n=1 Tax=Lineus longissimus TaxID=88925 RepID=UPI002B4E76AA
MKWCVTNSKPGKQQVKTIVGQVSDENRVKPHKTFASKKAYNCAVMMLVCGLLTIIGGISQEFAMYHMWGGSFHGWSIWIGVLFTIAGTCAVLACNKQSKPRLISATVFSIMTIITALVVIVLFGFCVAEVVKMHHRMVEMRQWREESGESFDKFGGLSELGEYEHPHGRKHHHGHKPHHEHHHHHHRQSWPTPTGRPWPRPTPTPTPTGRPWPRPTGRPWPRPTGRPWPRPTGRPWPRPTGRPWPRPTGRPWPRPTGRPWPRPTGRPWPRPTGRPWPRPTGRTWPRPTGRPWPRPTGRPWPRPTGHHWPRLTGHRWPRPTRHPWPRPNGHHWPKPSGRQWSRPTGFHWPKPTTRPMPTELPSPVKGTWSSQKAAVKKEDCKFTSGWPAIMLFVASLAVVTLVLIELVIAVILTIVGVRSLKAAKYELKDYKILG